MFEPDTPSNAPISTNRSQMPIMLDACGCCCVPQRREEDGVLCELASVARGGALHQPRASRRCGLGRRRRRCRWPSHERNRCMPLRVYVYLFMLTIKFYSCLFNNKNAWTRRYTPAAYSRSLHALPLRRGRRMRRRRRWRRRWRRWWRRGRGGGGEGDGERLQTKTLQLATAWWICCSGSLVLGPHFSFA